MKRQASFASAVDHEAHVLERCLQKLDVLGLKLDRILSDLIARNLDTLLFFLHLPRNSWDWLNGLKQREPGKVDRRDDGF